MSWGTIYTAFKSRITKAMKAAIEDIVSALETFGKPGPWSDDVKASDEVLEPIFRIFSKKLDLPLIERKRDFHKLVSLMDKGGIDPEIVEKLDLILATSKKVSGPS